MSTDVLIVGAGPTGLMLACQLALHPTISFRIIDKSVGCTTQSRALVVHARSLELFAQLNIADKAIAAGSFANTIHAFFLGRHWFRLDLSSLRQDIEFLRTRFPYVLMLEQSITEQLLEEFLNEHGVKIERETELIDIESINDEEIQATLVDNRIIRAKYVCACDGAHSVIRHKLHASFDGRTYSESLFIADCKLNHLPIGKGDVAIFLGSNGLAGVFPIVNDRHRLVGTIHEEKKDTNVNLSIDDLNRMFKERSERTDINIVTCNWVSSYRSHHRHVTSFSYQNRYFLLGDAAHIHSPVGGQGMNTGLQDALNLGWKLAFTLTHSANQNLLKTYHDERSIVAKTLVNTTDRMFALLTSRQWFTKFCRLYIVPFFLRLIIQPLFNYSKTIRKMAFFRLSQLGITYRSSTIWDYGASAGDFPRSTPAPGDRFPYAIFDSCHYHLLIFDSQPSAIAFVQSIRYHYAQLIQIHENVNIPFQMEGAILVRPDGYVAYRTKTFDFRHFQTYFAQYFS